MDTRSVVRTRRRSTRLTGHLPQDERSKRATAKKRDSDHGSSGNSSTSASRELSCPRADPNPNNALSGHDAHPVIQDDKATMASAKDETSVKALPLFPNLPSAMTKAPATPTTATASITALRNKSSVAPSGQAAKGHVTNKWVRTARGSIRLASDSPAETSREDTNQELGRVDEGRNAPPATARRLVAIKTEVAAGVTAGSDQTHESQPDLQDRSINVTAEHDRSAPSKHQGGLLGHHGKIGRLEQETKPLKDISPIPELLADIERIISSSPLATGNLSDEGTRDTPSPTPTQAVKRRAPTDLLTRSRTLRSSSRSAENTTRIGKSLDPERTDSETSQVDGAFDDTIHGHRRKEAQVGRGTATRPKPREARGTKRRAQELSESEGNAPCPGPRQRRKRDRGGPKPEGDMSTSNPIEAATSRDAFAADDPNADTALEMSEFARRSGEPPNPVTLAQMISTRPQRADADADADADSVEARDGSRQSSPEWVSSDNSSTRGIHGSRESSPPRGPEEGDTARCADCGRAPGRYLVCARCLAAVYCGKYCQLWDWPLHRARCGAAEGAVQAEVELQEAYLGHMWAAALRMLKEDNIAGGTVESLLLGEAVRRPPARPAFMGLGRHHGFTGTVVDSSHAVPRDSEGMENTRVRSIRLAQAAEGSDE